MNGAAGGAALSTIGLIEELRRTHGIEACVLCHDAGTKVEKERLIDVAGGRAVFAPLYMWNKQIRAASWKRPLIEVKQLLRTGATGWSSHHAADIVRKHQVDLVHTNTILTLEGAITARRFRLGHVWHLREMVGQGAPFRLPIEGPLLGRLLEAHASVVVANSEASAARVRNWLPKGLLAVVDNGLDLSGFQFVPPPARAHRPLVVAMVGSLTSRWKQHRVFVDAMALVRRDRPLVFRIYGHGPEDDPYVQDIVGAAQRAGIVLELAGFVSDPTAIMRDVDILVHPAKNESFGRIVVEAWAAGVPFVGVSSGGVGALVTHGHDGLLARPDDAAGVAAHVDQLIADVDLRARLATNGRQTAEQRFSIAGHGRRVVELYARALRRPLAPFMSGLRSTPETGAT